MNPDFLRFIKRKVLVFHDAAFRVKVVYSSLILDVCWIWPFRCCDCVGESESLSANPSESHLCFSPADLWPFSSSLLPNSAPVRSWGGTGEAGRGRRKRGNIFLWMFPVVPNVRKCFQAWRSHGAFLFFSKHRRASNFFCFVSFLTDCWEKKKGKL